MNSFFSVFKKLNLAFRIQGVLMFGCAVAPPNPYYILADEFETFDPAIPDYNYEDIIVNDHHSGIYCEVEAPAPWANNEFISKFETTLWKLLSFNNSHIHSIY